MSKNYRTHKDKTIGIRVPSGLLNDYKEYCDANCMNLSMRLRRFMEREIELWEAKKINDAKEIEKIKAKRLKEENKKLNENKK